ncbi:prepilin-type N-terminal cleavage/methylation domain-containing protein [Paenibacillus gorillae]|uniref:prepilin-type N-terminal cleavage/methylation domain-containing protein n=1 Tax=Paenibacillus gorillae TaxID=1243662 RepID=UPI0004B7AEAE|nr:prepilin-type N-terminal cleavage/methylation domain-containing protein [Paenibacillus gorillae]
MLMALKRNEKGLTLIELLAVLVIVGIIAAIAIPAIGNTIAKSRVKADNASISLIEESALRYVTDKELTATTTIPLADLVTNGYLAKTPVLNKLNITNIQAVLSASDAWSITVTTTPKT